MTYPSNFRNIFLKKKNDTADQLHRSLLLKGKLFLLEDQIR